MKSRFTLLFFLLIGIPIFAQHSGNYFVQFNSTKDSLPEYRLYVFTKSKEKRWETDINGVIKIQTDLSQLEDTLYISTLAHREFKFLKAQLKENDTLILFVKPNPITLNELVIFNQAIVIDPPYGASIEYPVADTSGYSAMLNGKWFKDNPGYRGILWKDFYEMLGYIIEYPYEARLKQMEERIYFGFDMNGKGKILRWRLLRGKNPILVVAAAQVLVTINGIYTENAVKSDRITEFVLPVNFKLE